ncbi:glutathione S-transferase family protein [Roseovarius rhodophyticola]|uniref:Glutathione S-transferase family protein n=1 Tax=Roseovarius rhodophyticola TaxID=3080827 RepID=A0ABZ2TK58_9RHOB|nr:glutathione S-transferase family protein [Roseovarius sp. W115]MDV2927930.1 glutathione S-transferase family protein [Roseovarius sp. W115]
MKLYDHPVSGHAHRASAMLSLLGLDYENVIVDLQSGAHKQPEYLKLNPLGQVPTLQDGDVVLRDSTAILTYLALQYDPARSWLPNDPELAGKVQEWLATSVKEVFEGPCGARISKFFGAPIDFDWAVEKTHMLMKTLFEPHLAQNDWLVGTAPTIADIANYGYIAATSETGISLADYPNVRAWLARIEALNGFPKIKTVAEVMGNAA